MPPAQTIQKESLSLQGAHTHTQTQRFLLISRNYCRSYFIHQRGDPQRGIHQVSQSPLLFLNPHSRCLHMVVSWKRTPRGTVGAADSAFSPMEYPKLLGSSPQPTSQRPGEGDCRRAKGPEGSIPAMNGRKQRMELKQTNNMNMCRMVPRCPIVIVRFIISFLQN